MLNSRKNIRLNNYNYSQDGYYFITVCTYNRNCLFGEIIKGKMALNECGRVVQDEWLKSAKIRNEIKTDKFVVMPNHFHAILAINNLSVGLKGSAAMPMQATETNIRPYEHTSLQSPSKNLGAVIRGFKSSVTVKINIMRNTPQGPVWQSKYHDRIIRNDYEYQKIWEYIDTNPLKWHKDCYYKI